MKSIILSLIAVVIPFHFASGQEQYVSRFGVIEINKDDEDPTKHQLLLDGKEIFHYEAQSIEIPHILKGNGRDYLIVALNSGGIACPVQFVIIEVYKSGAPQVSKEFGACTEPTSVRLVNDRVIIETPLNSPHPDLLSKQELRRRKRTKEVYTWYRGRLTTRTVSR